MKNAIIVTIIVSIFTMILLGNIAYAATITTPIVTGGLLKVELAKYEPFPAEAGKFVNIWIKVDNIGIEAVKNVTFILELKYPFTLPDNDPEKYHARITGLDDINLEYRLLVDKDAPNATSEVKLKYHTGDFVFKEKTMKITVKEGEKKEKADLKALFVDAEPVPYPGATTRLTVDIVNVDDGTAYHTIVRADSEIAEINRNEIFIGDLEADDFDSVDFDIKIKNDVKQGRYPVNITAIYKDDDSNEIVQSDIVYFTVISAEEAIKMQIPETPSWMYVVYIIVLIIILRAALYPFVKWFIKPFRRKKQ